MSEQIEFFVAGECVPKGSTKAFYIKKLGKVVTTNANPKTRDWQLRISMEAQAVLKEHPGWYSDDKSIGYEVKAEFRFTRPKSMPKRWKLMTKRPDLDKLVRICDSMTGIVFPDDSQIISFEAQKRYCNENEMPGVWVSFMKILSK